MFFLVIFSVFTISSFQVGIFESRSSHYGISGGFSHKLVIICSQDL